MQQRRIPLEEPVPGSSTAKRAENIAIIYLRIERDDLVEVRSGKDQGADLLAEYASGETQLFEVKGSKTAEVWGSHFVVSGRYEYIALTESNVPILRVTEVETTNPLVTPLLYGWDYTLEKDEFRFNVIQLH